MTVNELAPGRSAAYRRALSRRDFRLLWLGSSVSLVGDGMTLVALTWLVLSQPDGVQRVGLLTVCYTLPVFVGGLLAGPVLDRFDKRHVLAADSVVRGVAMAAIPIMSAVGEVPEALPFVVAVVYGLFKMVPLAGFPAAIPDLVPERDRDAANALESLSFSLSGMAGPALGGLLIAWLGSEAVLAFDAVSYVVFAVAALAVRRPLTPRTRTDEPGPAHLPGDGTERPPGGGVLTLLGDRVLVMTTLAFMAFNIAMGMLMVTAPWLAGTRLDGGPRTLGLLLAALSAGELAGAVMAGARSPRTRPVRAIGVVQLVAAAGFLAILSVPHTLGVAAGFLVIGMFSAPMTIWAQSLRMARIPAPLRGRGFAVLRTLMQATPPIGAAAVTPLLAAGTLTPAVLVMAVVAAAPALALLAARP
ncbi:MFS transporter [Nonomuraea jiangxiensis]|uniref:Predicted arabinose efflux permease, MFS family n=1 Tax=Nonomuraea jiangxiensis TaxID=633440 RepID=A0A1G8DER7_9ACTN|nr:MFS transporter [Nonomuraea jiangxiensis]SDH56207.1 Predicted arabinose efflux permease, MFS family [Nonomuraea jiangxiensis]